MENSSLFSRRGHARRKVDFRPDADPKSPFAQLRRLSVYLQESVPPQDDITDCPDALDALREYSYRKIFTGTSHEDFVRLDQTDPEAIDWLVAIHEAETSAHNARRTR